MTEPRNTKHTQKPSNDGSARVALFVPSLNGGGAERVMSILARGFAARGLNVDLVLVNTKGPYLADIPDAVRIVDLRSRRILTSLPGLVRYLRRERPQALLSTLLHTNVVALWAAALSRVPVRTVIRQANMLNLGAGRKKRLKERALTSFFQHTVTKADAVIVLNKTMAEELQDTVQLPSARIEIINNPVPTERIAERADEELAHPWFASDQPPVILSAGRLTYQKDFANLIDAFSIVRRQQTARLMILGEGELRGELETQVKEHGLKDHVSMPGLATNPYKYMRRAAVFVLPSRWEGFPNVLVEAMACGAKVIATDCAGGTDEILNSGRWGRLVPPCDPHSLASAISAELTTTENSESYRGVDRYSADKITDKYKAVLVPDQ